ncbi:MAG: methyltransferase FkbM family [Chitinophagaceae bacterium]|nr:methyltransferase FkbM family [Chitinophagaceae bacterium]
MKKKLKLFLQKKRLYYKLRFSFVFRCYQYLFKAGDLERQQKEIVFYKSFLPACNIIFDIGAYDGHKTAAFLQIAKKVISCEPDQQSFSILKDRFRNTKQVFLENIAVADSPGERHFFIHRPGSAFNTLSLKWKETLEQDSMEKWDEKIIFSEGYKVTVTTLDLLIQKYGKPDFIKLDVEGYEENVLKALSQPVSFLSFEVLWPGGLLEIQHCFEKLQSLDPRTLYNIAVYEKLLLPSFVDRERIMERLRENDLIHLEIIAKMNQ